MAVGIPGPGVAYVLGLAVATECLALLTLGLVRPWGERLPYWLPYCGGRAIRPMAVVFPAALGAAALTAGPHSCPTTTRKARFPDSLTDLRRNNSRPATPFSGSRAQ